MPGGFAVVIRLNSKRRRKLEQIIRAGTSPKFPLMSLWSTQRWCCDQVMRAP